MREINKTSFFKSSFTMLNRKDSKVFGENFHRRTKVSSEGRKEAIKFLRYYLEKIELILTYFLSTPLQLSL